MSKTILIVDDSIYMRSMIGQLATTAGYTIVGEAGDGETAISMAISLKPDLITLDNILPDMIGIDILRILKEDEKITSKVIIISAVGQEAVINEGLSLGACDYLTKPFTPDQFFGVLNKIDTEEVVDDKSNS
jgi:two-component system chemotaxis response regulator CheY